VEVESRVLGRQVKASAGGSERVVDVQRSANESLIVRWIVVGVLEVVCSTLAWRKVW